MTQSALDGQWACSNSWAWFDAGLNTNEINRAVASIQSSDVPRENEIRIQFYPEYKKLSGSDKYFNGKCPIWHTLNAKVIWGRRKGLKALHASFNECLGEIAAQHSCTCFDEETILAHIHQKIYPCQHLKNHPPEFKHIDVIPPLN